MVESAPKAFDLSFHFAATPEPDLLLRTLLEELTVLRDGIPSLQPGQEYRTFAFSTFEHGRSLEGSLHVIARFRDSAGIPHSERFIIDMRSYARYSRVGEPASLTVAKAAKKSAETLASASRSLAKLVDAARVERNRPSE